MAFTHFVGGSSTLSQNRRMRALRLTALAIMMTSLGAASSAQGGAYSMRNIEGEILSVGQHTGEGDLDLVQAQLRSVGNGDAVELLLAPQGVCDQIGFEIGPGDRVRARVFLDDSSSYRVQKIQNLSRGMMVRLRTLHQTPLWNSVGTWEGGPVRSSPWQHRHGQKQRGGGPPR